MRAEAEGSKPLPGMAKVTPSPSRRQLAARPAFPPMRLMPSTLAAAIRAMGAVKVLKAALAPQHSRLCLSFELNVTVDWKSFIWVNSWQ